MLKYIATIIFVISGLSCSDEPIMDCVDNPTSVLYGTWDVVKVSKKTFTHPYCQYLINGSKFVFACDSRVFVYNKNQPNPCTARMHFYAFKDSTIEIWEGDMILNYDIYHFNKDTLKIKRFEELTLIRRGQLKD